VYATIYQLGAKELRANNMYRTKQILETLATRIKALGDTINHYADSIHTEKHTKRDSEPPINQVNAVIRFDEESIRHADSQYEDQHTTQKSTNNATWAAFWAALLFAVIALCQWSEMKRATVAATDAAKAAQGQLRQMQDDSIASAQRSDATTVQAITAQRVDERAWIAVTVEKYRFEEGSPLTVDLEVNNVGKTVALMNPGSYIIGEMRRDGNEPDFTYPEKHKTVGRYGAAINLAYVLPKSAVKMGIGYGTKLPDGTIVNKPLSTKDFTDLSGNKARFFVHGIANYNDFFGVPHWIRFCYVYKPLATSGGPAGMVNCDHNNRIDSNPEYGSDAQK
jgi:hypothetical protein